MSACLHLDGTRDLGKEMDRHKAPTQSEKISTCPRVSCSALQMARITKWIASRPSNSAQHALALGDCSGKEPMILPLPFEHSNTKAAEHTPGHSSLM